MFSFIPLLNKIAWSKIAITIAHQSIIFIPRKNIKKISLEEVTYLVNDKMGQYSTVAAVVANCSDLCNEPYIYKAEMSSFDISTNLSSSQN